MRQDRPNFSQIALAGVAALGLIGMAYLIAEQANALEIQNEDAKDYEVRIIEGASSKTVKVAAYSISTDLCREQCRIVVTGGGSIEAETGDVIRIDRGVLIPEPN